PVKPSGRLSASTNVRMIWCDHRGNTRYRAVATLVHTLSLGLRSGNRRPGSSVIDSILRPPKSSTALYVLLPLNQTSTGHVTIAVFASVIFAFFIARIAGPVAANFTCRTTGDGIPPS